MPRFDYSELATLAIDLIEEFGDDLTLTKPGTKTGPDYDPTVGAPTSSPIVALEVDWTQMYRDQTKVQANDKFWMVSTAGATPELPDTITYPVTNGKTYQIENIVPFKPGPTVMFNVVQARR